MGREGCPALHFLGPEELFGVLEQAATSVPFRGPKRLRYGAGDEDGRDVGPQTCRGYSHFVDKRQSSQGKGRRVTALVCTGVREAGTQMP